ncbi:MAG: hypothetical protein H8E02_00320 [Synechococcus sp.]|nr:hypothetical protein [Synechococcus sp.]
MSNKPWFQANIHAPGTGIALVVIALTLLPVGIDAAMRAWCVAALYEGTTLKGKPFSPDRIALCNG